MAASTKTHDLLKQFEPPSLQLSQILSSSVLHGKQLHLIKSSHAHCKYWIRCQCCQNINHRTWEIFHKHKPQGKTNLWENKMVVPGLTDAGKMKYRGNSIKFNPESALGILGHPQASQRYWQQGHSRSWKLSSRTLTLSSLVLVLIVLLTRHPCLGDYFPSLLLGVWV